ncbi:MAG TPA: ABC transporter substrate-binding protein [Chloroflexota bacterium]|nr:ABC transporter substrate-binding protein [Chloroflexota bacterium]
MKHFPVRIASFVATMLLLAACGGATAAPASSPASSSRAAGSAAPASASPAPSAVKVNFHLPSRSTSYLPWYIAQEKGFFKEQNLTVDFVQANSTVGIDSLISGETQFTGAASAAMAAVGKGAALKTIFIESARANYWLTAKPGIKSLADLKGKTIVTPNIGNGDTYYRLAAAALKKAGLDPTKDVQFIGAGSAGGGSGDVLVTALVAGRADAMVGNILQRLAAEAQGFTTIHSFADDSADLQGGIATSDKLLSSQPDEVRRFLIAGVKGMRVMAADPATSVAVTLKYVQLKQEDAQKALEIVTPLMTKDGLVTSEQAKEGLDSIRQGVDMPASVTPDTAFTFAPLQEAIKTVDASGWKPS